MLIFIFNNKTGKSVRIGVTSDDKKSGDGGGNCGDDYVAFFPRVRKTERIRNERILARAHASKLTGQIGTARTR